MTIECFDKQHLPTTTERENLVQFLFEHLDKYGDPREQIESCLQYALSENDKPGGFALVAYEGDKLMCATIVNATNMSGYIPENILVYIATHRDARGKGIGSKILKTAIKTAKGDVALHVEPDNPAKFLYEKVGMTNKYLEMRYHKIN